MNQISLHDQVPIEIYRYPVGHEASCSSNSDDSDVFEEDTIDEVHNSSPGVAIEDSHLIHDVSPWRHVETNISKMDHLQIGEFCKHPAKNCQVNVEIFEEHRPDHPDVEILGGVVTAELHDGTDVPNVDGEMTSRDVVGSSTLLDEIPLFIQGWDLTRTVIRILSVDGDGDRKKNSILDA